MKNLFAATPPGVGTRTVPGVADQATDVDAYAGPAQLLIIDDEIDNLQLILDLLRDYDFAIRTATAGCVGIEIAHQQRPDLILLDLCMPGMDGYEVLGSLKAHEAVQSIPVILLTAADDVESKLRGFALGAEDYLTKPVSEAELLARVTAYLRRHRLQRALEHRLRAYESRYGALDDDASSADRQGLAAVEVERLYQARQLLRERLADPPSLNALAEAVGTNQPRLSRGFRVLFGTTVFGFLREARLARARELLIHTSWPIKTIAFEVGYRNSGDLTRGIKERFGLTPTELRERR